MIERLDGDAHACRYGFDVVLQRRLRVRVPQMQSSFFAGITGNRSHRPELEIVHSVAEKVAALILQRSENSMSRFRTQRM